MTQHLVEVLSFPTDALVPEPTGSVRDQTTLARARNAWYQLVQVFVVSANGYAIVAKRLADDAAKVRVGVRRLVESDAGLQTPLQRRAEYTATGALAYHLDLHIPWLAFSHPFKGVFTSFLGVSRDTRTGVGQMAIYNFAILMPTLTARGLRAPSGIGLQTVLLEDLQSDITVNPRLYDPNSDPDFYTRGIDAMQGLLGGH